MALDEGLLQTQLAQDKIMRQFALLAELAGVSLKVPEKQQGLFYQVATKQRDSFMPINLRNHQSTYLHAYQRRLKLMQKI